MLPIHLDNIFYEEFRAKIGNRYPVGNAYGQRKIGPPLDWMGPPPVKGCEVFIGNLPRDIIECEQLIPIFSTVGRIYAIRIMIDIISVSNRGYGFVMYSSRSEASRAIKELDNYEIRPRKFIGIHKSIENCCLSIFGLPKINKGKEEIMKELSEHVTGLVDIRIYPKHNQGHIRYAALAEFTSHENASIARLILAEIFKSLWNLEVKVYWADRKPDIDDEPMVKTLFIGNLPITTNTKTVKSIIKNLITNKIKNIVKIYDHAFVHFYQREDAELAVIELQNVQIEGNYIEIAWAKPFNKKKSKIQRITNNYSKNKNEISESFMEEKLQVLINELRKYFQDRGIDVCKRDLPCISIEDILLWNKQNFAPKSNYIKAPEILELICKRFTWLRPEYNYQWDHLNGIKLWVSSVKLPLVGPPIFMNPCQIGPYFSYQKYSKEQAQIEAAEMMLHQLQSQQQLPW